MPVASTRSERFRLPKPPGHKLLHFATKWPVPRSTLPRLAMPSWRWGPRGGDRRPMRDRRALQDRLRRNRAGELPFADWAVRFDAAWRKACRARVDASWQPYEARSRESWRWSRASREAWWLEWLGPEEFWSRRLTWLLRKGHHVAFARAVAKLRAEGFPITRHHKKAPGMANLGLRSCPQVATTHRGLLRTCRRCSSGSVHPR